MPRLRPAGIVCINGAGGGAGMFAIQLAKMYGAQVTAVDTAQKAAFMKQLGADNVLNFEKEDFTAKGGYDLIVDNTARRSVDDYKRALNRNGSLAIVGGSIGLIFKVMLLGRFLKGDKRLKVVIHKANQNLEELVDLVKKKSIKPAIDRSFSLDDTVEAFEYFASNKFTGKVVITV